MPTLITPRLACLCLFAFLLFPQWSAAQDQRAVLELIVNRVPSGESLVVLRDHDALVPVETLQKLKIYFDCGDKDRFGFDKSNAELHKILDERKVEHEWHLRSGNHGRDYYEEYCPLSFQFHGAIFDAAPKGGAKNPKH